MSKHRPTVVWAIRRRGTSSQGYVTTQPSGNLRIDYIRDGYGSVSLTLSRQDAKMLARRITECLEATR